MCCRSRMIIVLACCGCLALVGACKREDRGFRVDPPSAEMAGGNVTLSSVAAGGPSSRPATSSQPIKNEYEENAYALTEGQHLYESFNCVGCHFHGGGGIGPPLMDDKWIYGGEPQQIYSTIIQGRPNGMPSFRGKIPNHQAWQIVAYVRSLSGNASKQAAPGRSDHISGGTPPNSTKTQKPVISEEAGGPG